MPVEPTPLFRADVLAPRSSGFAVPEYALEARGKLDRWVELYHSPRGEDFKETELRADFITHVFQDILGFTGPVSTEGEDYTLSREKLVEVDGKFADAVLGRFSTHSTAYDPIVAVEAKGPRNPLDRAYGGRPLSAVDQGYRYAINLPCDWIIVTNLKEIRLYYKGATQRRYERFDVETLASSEGAFRRFVYLLGAERVVPEAGDCHLYELYRASEAAGERVTQAFYDEYAAVRRDLLDALGDQNPSLTPTQLIGAAQKLLDRILFVAFCEDRGLLPPGTIEKAYSARNPYNPQPVWANFQGLFTAIDKGDTRLDIPKYNGGLFAPDPVIQGLTVPDSICEHFKRLGDYDYRSPSMMSGADGEGFDGALIDVEVLGHIFEQSITDLEELHSEIAEEEQDGEGRTRRQREGAFYTPEFITQRIVSQTLQPVLRDRFESERAQHESQASGTSVRVLRDPRAYDVEKLNNPQKDSLIEFWKAWIDELKTIRILDPACGSGAFLIEAFDQLYPEYWRANERLTELYESKGSDEQLALQLDPNRTILQNNLYGVDLNAEAVQICRLSIWIKTAERRKKLADLDHNIRDGNSIIADREVDPRAFDWKDAFPEVFEQGGFDVVLGNPPYVRAEQLRDIKPYLEEHYEAYHGSGDLYIYFFELGLRLLRPGGYLSYVVTNKWLRVGYAAALRRLFAESTQVKSVLDLGHAREVFPDADVFPSIVVVRKSSDRGASREPVEVCVIPRDELSTTNLTTQIRQRTFEVPQKDLGADPWSLEPAAVSALMKKVVEAGVPLADYMGQSPKYGIKTGLNRAFLVDQATKERLIEEDDAASEVLVPFLRGEDIKRWTTDFAERWMLLLKSSGDHVWPWTGQGEDAEAIFKQTYPSVYGHLTTFKERLKERSDQGQHWWELRSCSYYDLFTKPKIVHTDISWQAEFAFSDQPVYLLNTAYMWPADDLYLLGAVNSPLMWYYLWRTAPHGKDEALRLIRSSVNALPIAPPDNDTRSAVSSRVEELIQLSRERRAARDRMLDWLAVEFNVTEPGTKLASIQTLSADDFIAAVRNQRPGNHHLSSQDVRRLRDEFGAVIAPLRAKTPHVARLESEVSSLVNGAYGLTDDDVKLLWSTAPPRMPIEPPPLVTRVASDS